MSDLSKKAMLEIIKRKDPKYDGRFYFAVKTTKIYCRPTCPAKPKPENIIILKSSTQAESQGYRPCKRCKPDELSIIRIYDLKFKIVEECLSIIDTSSDPLSVEKLSELVGVSTRHLNRLFKDYLGSGPKGVILSHQLHTAKRFLLGTNEKIIDIAHASGFNSLRTFNYSFKSLYKQTPSTMRKMTSTRNTDICNIFYIKVIPPYDWEYMTYFLKRHLIFGVEEINESIYKRYLFDQDQVAYCLVSFEKDKNLITIKFFNTKLNTIKKVLPILKNMFDLNHNPHFLPTRSDKKKSIRIPGGFNNFELAVSIILGQLISVEQATLKLKQLVIKFGKRVDECKYEFPSKSVLLNREIEQIGITKMKATAI